MLDIQERARETAKRYVDRATESCLRLGFPLTDCQRHAICCAIAGILQPQMEARALRFADALITSAKRTGEIKAWSNEKLAEALVNDVWSDMTIGTLESDLVDEVVNRLRLIPVAPTAEGMRRGNCAAKP